MGLVDANMDVHLRSVSLEKGVVAESAWYRGWTELVHGALVSEAAGAGFDDLLTREMLFGEAAAQALKRFPGFAVVVVTLHQALWIRYRETLAAQWERAPIVPLPGRLVWWPTSPTPATTPH